jgi:hypothetical protein
MCTVLLPPGGNPIAVKYVISTKPLRIVCNCSAIHIASCLRRLIFMSSAVRTLNGATVVSLQVRGQLKCDGTRAQTRFRLSARRMSPFISAGASVQSTTGSRGVRISGSNAGYIMFRRSVKGTGYPHHSSVSPSLPLPCVTVCHHISTAVYHSVQRQIIFHFI